MCSDEYRPVQVTAFGDGATLAVVVKPYDETRFANLQATRERYRTAREAAGDKAAEDEDVARLREEVRPLVEAYEAAKRAAAPPPGAGQQPCAICGGGGKACG